MAKSYGTSEGRALGRADAKGFKQQGGAVGFGIKVEIKGLEQMQRMLRDFPKKAEAEFGKAVQLAARALAEGGRLNADTPVKTGRLRASINHRKLARLAAATFVGVNYGLYVHEGTSRMAGRPFLKWTLERGFQKKIDDIFAAAMKRVP